ncbi:MAG: NAD+ synthase [Acidobacteria bacterium]|nr:NAD+ synthase [Acidobacteriota bacterium]
MRIACAQVNTVVGDLEGNLALVRDAVRAATARGASLVLTPELALTGYPPEDLLLRPSFADASREALEALAADLTEGVAIVGFVEHDEDVHNAAAVLADGRVQAIYRKRFLPNYGVFDEARYFRAGDSPMVLDVDGARVGVVICEDIWYPAPVAAELAEARLDVIACISSSPFHLAKGDARERMLQTRASDSAAALAYCNQVGGQDELVFDGRSVIIDHSGDVVARAPMFEDHLLLADVELDLAAGRRLREPLLRRLPRPGGPDPVAVEVPARGAVAAADDGEAASDLAAVPCEEGELWGALVLGVRDYVGKNGFPGVIIGLSGGIDSALTAAIAVDALGPDRVRGVAMPSVFTSGQSTDAAAALAASLGIRMDVIPIAPVVDAFEEQLAEVFEGRPRDVAEENLQARVRGTLLMAISNKHGDMVLATGNKSEMSVGYSTIYGDMAGGFAPLRDVSKTWVYRLASWRNRDEGREVIPQATIERAPTAELRPDQRDSDSLPAYEVLDPILEAYVEQDLPPTALVERGFPDDVVRRVIGMVDRAEYKRRQGPPGIKTTPRAFGRDRRMPITNRYAED